MQPSLHKIVKLTIQLFVLKIFNLISQVPIREFSHLKNINEYLDTYVKCDQNCNGIGTPTGLKFITNLARY